MVTGVMHDRQGRRITYLRLSVTDRCNFRCSYCMPDDVEFTPRAELLSFEEAERIVRLFVKRGTRRLRLTGGEPTVRKDVVRLVERLSAISQLDEIAMTSNGSRLGQLAGPLRAAGLASVNISLDSANPQEFKAMTRGGNFDDVCRGIQAALDAQLLVKVNAVLGEITREETIQGVAHLAWDRGIIPRYIEQMPLSAGSLLNRKTPKAVDVMAALASDGPWQPAASPKHTGPASYFHNGKGQRFGIIAPLTGNFCASCNRARITARGDFHACLGHDDALSLRDVLREGATDEQISDAVDSALHGKRDSHLFEFAEKAPRKHMVVIGG